MQNIHLGIATLGWKIDWKKFRIYLRDKYYVEKAYIFIGYLPKMAPLYRDLEMYGYTLCFKPVSYLGDGNIKGNCDADLIVSALTTCAQYDKAIVVTGDGDFYSLVRYLFAVDKLETVLCPSIRKCSLLLHKEARGRITDIESLASKIAKNATSTHRK